MAEGCGEVQGVVGAVEEGGVLDVPLDPEPEPEPEPPAESPLVEGVELSVFGAEPDSAAAFAFDPDRLSVR